MTIAFDAKTDGLLAEYLAHLKTFAAKEAFAVLVEHARSDTKYQLIPRRQGALERTCQYMVGTRWAYGFIVNTSDLLFYYRSPSGRVTDGVFAHLREEGLAPERNAAGEIKVRITSVQEARTVLEDCFGKPQEAEWSDEELRASVIAYRVMQDQARANEPGPSKKEVYRTLARRFNRTEKAFEFRMQNISAVLSMLGREWISGLKPAAHVGANVAVRIERLINELGGASETPRLGFELAVKEAQKRKNEEPPAGQTKPGRVSSSSSSYIRDAAVKAWVLNRALGSCESCESPAPFQTPDGTPFLEVHHLRTLADGGSDTTGNAVALCPNCHRRMHYGKDGAEIRNALLAKISGLRSE